MDHAAVTGWAVLLLPSSSHASMRSSHVAHFSVEECCLSVGQSGWRPCVVLAPTSDPILHDIQNVVQVKMQRNMLNKRCGIKGKGHPKQYNDASSDLYAVFPAS
ncbi:hypothetical protein TRIUR3_06952 [Triticum urartu]|uniref:Uncharacterized protein n=1 Tax=Triticum urartu TaxID=4572 RepID=M7ZAN4_TRIUA|nr:hypothetical protein TRIUR3_06952 [Triticum urartu]